MLLEKILKKVILVEAKLIRVFPLKTSFKRMKFYE